MSKPAKATNATNTSTPALVPALRFPEFRNAPEWSSVQLANCTIPVTERVGDKALTPISISAGIGFVPQAEKFGRDISGNQYSLYTHVRKGDFVFNKGNSLKFPQGCVYQLKNWEEVAAPNVFISFRFKDGYWPGFYEYCFEKNLHGQQLKRFITSGARSNGLLNISKDTFFGIALPYPKIDEQKKIADCLSSLDELITAQASKVEALKAHKKGLMQQLFPAEGQTIPALRFPEFRNAGEWHADTLGNVCEVLNNKRQPVSSDKRTSGEYPYYGASGIVDYINDYIFDERLLLVGEDGAKWGAFEKTAFLAEGKYWVNNHAHVLKPVSVVDALLENYLTMIDMAPYVTGAAPPKLTLGKLKEISVPIPPLPKEQQKIADCLSSLDELIAAEVSKVETLKAHKKGLMQQLFPTIHEDAA